MQTKKIPSEFPMTASQALLKEGQLYENLRRVVTVIDELRDVGLQQYVNLPRIAVVGGQSGGKSSVLESIVGADFLPRGDGVVTRRPLELRLVHLAADTGLSTYAVFGTAPEKKLQTFDEVKAEIIRQTEQIAGRNRGIVDDPIILTIFSTTCPDLTLIDLPGITRVPVKNSDQTEDIEKITKQMAMRYIQDPRTIILAVVAANQDMSTSDALQMARQVDPQGIRTIGVITKIDIMDPGTDAVRMLLGEEVHLRLGFVGVKNRGQADIKGDVRVQEALNHEKTWFDSHPKYGKLGPGYLGTEALVSKLTKVLFAHIKSVLPQIKREIADRTKKVQERLQELGEGVPETLTDQIQLIWTMISDYCEIIKNTIKGKYDRRLQIYSKSSTDTRASGGAQIRAVFNSFLGDFTKATADLSDQDIDQAIRMHEGDSLPGFPSPDIFEFLILPHLCKIEQPVADCLNSISSCLDLLSQRTAKTVFRRFPKLGDSVLELAASIIAREREKTKGVIENIVHYETGYLFTNDSSYLESHGSLGNKPNAPVGTAAPPPPQTLPSGNIGYITEIRSRLDSYYQLVVRNVRDSVPKAIGHFLVRQVQEKLQFELYHSLNKSEVLADLLGEPESVRSERKQMKQQLQVLENSSQVLAKDPAIAAVNMETEIEVEKTVVAPPITKAAPSGFTAAAQASTQLFNSIARPVRAAATSLFEESPKPRQNNPLFE